MHRFFVPSEQISDNNITITGSDVNHIKNVLRMKVGDKIEVFDSSGSEYKAIIKEINTERVLCRIAESRQQKAERRINVTLAQCLPKAKKMDFIIQKATELGVDSIIPVISERSIPKIEDKADKKISHWQKTAKEAAEQSGRTDIPGIKPLIKFEDLIKTVKNYSIALLPWEGEKNTTLKKSLNSILLPPLPQILILIGPEGGFSQEEVDLAKKAGFQSMTLGKRILRTETAGIVMLAQLSYELGN